MSSCYLSSSRSSSALLGDDLAERLGPHEHFLLPGRERSEDRDSRFAADPAPHVRPRVEVARQTLALGLRIVHLGDLDHLLLDVCEGVEGDVVDLVLDAVLLESQTAASEEDVSFAGSREIRDAVLYS